MSLRKCIDSQEPSCLHKQSLNVDLMSAEHLPNFQESSWSVAEQADL